MFKEHLFKFVLAAMLLILSNGKLNGQIDIEKLRSVFEATQYLGRNSHSELLKLNDLQLQVQNQLRREHSAWKRDTFKDYGTAEHKKAMLIQNLGMYHAFVDVLDDEQTLLIDQYIVSRYYSDQALLELTKIGLTPSDASSILALTHPDVQQAFGLNDQQTTRITLLIDDLAGLKKQNLELKKSRLRKFFDDWQAELLNVLDRKQSKRYEEFVGDDFVFGDQIGSVTSTSYIMGRLPLRTQVSRFSGRAPGNLLIYRLANLESRFEGKFELPGLFAFLSVSEVRQELKLSESQSETLGNIQSKFLADFPNSKMVQIENAYGLDMLKNPDNEKTPDNNQARTAEFDDKARQDSRKRDNYQIEILQALNDQQNSRLRQIWHQLVIEFGWRDVPLCHPDWKRVLELDERQLEKFNLVNDKQRKAWAALSSSNQEEDDSRLEQTKAKLIDVLSKEQYAKMTSAFGPFIFVDFSK